MHENHDEPPSSPGLKELSQLTFETLDSPTRENYLREYGQLNFASIGGGTIPNVEKDPDNEPPYSRIFVVCGKTVTEQTMRDLFKACGEIEYVKVVKDKTTNESKGVAYIKFTKASAAALAIELLNGKQIQDDTVPLKVMIADAKGSRNATKITSKEPEDTPPRSRLFIICSKDLTEEDLTTKFKAYGDLEYLKLMRDRTSGESKGCGYAKFSKSSTAAIVMETINEQAEATGAKLRTLIAHPKTKRGSTDTKVDIPFFPQFFPFFPSIYGEYWQQYPQQFPMASYPRQRLYVVVNKSVTQEQLAKLFSRFPGMEYCDLKKDKQSGESKGFAYINYSSPQTASLAKQQLDGIEFPPGHILKVMFAEPLGAKSSQSSTPSSYPAPGSPKFTEPALIPATTTPDPYAAMHAMMGYTWPPVYTGPMIIPEKLDDRSTDPPGSRLFVVMLNKILPEYVLQGMFGQIAGLEYIRITKDKNYGYVKYTSAAAAQCALNYYDGLDIHGSKLKVQIAQPPSESRKRQRT